MAHDHKHDHKHSGCAHNHDAHTHGRSQHHVDATPASCTSQKGNSHADNSNQDTKNSTKKSCSHEHSHEHGHSEKSGGHDEHLHNHAEKSCGHEHSHHDHSTKSCGHSEPHLPLLVDSDDETEATNPVCFALSHNNEKSAGIDIYDRDGEVVGFVVDDEHSTPAPSNTKHGDLCFLTHGHDDVADLLTPCFDSTGRHLKPDAEKNRPESCSFCDEDDAHLHAHFYSDKCRMADERLQASSTKKTQMDPSFLAGVVLRPAPAHGMEDSAGKDSRMLPGLDSLPQHQPCNSEQYRNLLADKQSEVSSCCADSNLGVRKRKRGRKMHPVRHHDHVDYLVYHEESKSVHLEHPCGSCGETDIHGKFNFVGQRKWKTSSKSEEMRLHFFEVPSAPFSFVEAFAELFETNSSRIDVVRPASCCNANKQSGGPASGHAHEHSHGHSHEHSGSCGHGHGDAVPPAGPGRSQFHVKGICCSSEVPDVKAIVEPIPGVHGVSINVTTRHVYVEHDVSTLSAQQIKARLDQNGFPATILKDAGLTVSARMEPPRNGIVQSQLHVSGICCSSEIPAINSIVTPLTGVKKVSINVTTKIVYVEHDPSVIPVQDIAEILNINNFGATVQKDGSIPFQTAKAEQKDSNKNCFAKFSVTLSGLFWIVSMLSLNPDWDNIKYAALGSVFISFPPITLKVFRTLRRKRFDTNCLMFFAVVGALALRELTEAAAVCFLFSISDVLESRATRRARDALSSIVNLRPESANVIDPVSGDVSVVPADAVVPGQHLMVRTGEKIPCDGVVLEGTSLVDESALTGESRPIKKIENDDVSGGTINIGSSPLVVNATAIVEHSAVARLIRLVEEAQANRSPTEKLVDKFAKFYTPVVVVSALLMSTVPWLFGREVGKEWFHMGMMMIIVACPCALIISTPVTYVAGLAALAQRGVIVKGGAHLEALGRIGKVAVDKTGTLTEGKFKLLHLDIVGNKYSREEILEMLAALEGPSVHPLANALLQAAENEGIKISAIGHVKDHTILKGEGVQACFKHTMVYVGNHRLFHRISMYSALDSSVKEKVDGWSSLGGTVGYVGVEGVGIVAAYCAADAVRSEANDVVAQLKGLGIEVSMLTGDSKSAAAAVGKQVGIATPNICAELLPKEKLDLVRQMKEDKIEDTSFLCSGKRQGVLMCGDGINDTPALALANVGVAMGAGAVQALETSDVTLMDNNLYKLLKSIKMGRKVIQTIRENMVFSMLSKLVVFVYMAFKGANLWIAIGTDLGAMLIVTLNGMKLLPTRKKIRDMPTNEMQ